MLTKTDLVVDPPSDYAELCRELKEWETFVGGAAEQFAVFLIEVGDVIDAIRELEGERDEWKAQHEVSEDLYQGSIRRAEQAEADYNRMREQFEASEQDRAQSERHLDDRESDLASLADWINTHLRENHGGAQQASGWELERLRKALDSLVICAHQSGFSVIKGERDVCLARIAELEEERDTAETWCSNKEDWMCRAEKAEARIAELEDKLERCERERDAAWADADTWRDKAKFHPFTFPEL